MHWGLINYDLFYVRTLTPSPYGLLVKLPQIDKQEKLLVLDGR